jgi:YaiO family outer membrane protein
MGESMSDWRLSVRDKVSEDRSFVTGRLAWKALVAGVVWVAMVAVIPAAHADEDVVARAGSLARRGKEHQAEAVALLQQRLAQAPDDTDARVLYGIVLSWQGNYDEARVQLSQVLEKNPTHGDALPALIDVELWSQRPERAEQLAEQGLAQDPKNIGLLLLKAQALRDMKRYAEARSVLAQVLKLEPGNKTAKEMHRSMTDTEDKWEASTQESYDWFSDGRSALHETSLYLRGQSPWGPILGTFSRADQYSLTSYQTQVDFYPRFRPGTYADINVGYSADANLYPSYRAGADLFQSVGHGFEVSGGYRHLGFSTGVNIYTFALAKYYSDWLFTARGYVTPGDSGTSGTAVFSARRFFGSEGLHNYVEVDYSQGASPATAQTIQEIVVLNSSSLSATLDKSIHGRWGAQFIGSISDAQQTGIPHLRHYSAAGQVYYKF